MLRKASRLYERSAIAAPFADKEQFRVLFLDKRNQLIADEPCWRGNSRARSTMTTAPAASSPRRA
jgi:DNA repair protein RadC